jgi:hypothetical protein
MNAFRQRRGAVIPFYGKYDFVDISTMYDNTLAGREEINSDIIDYMRRRENSCEFKIVIRESKDKQLLKLFIYYKYR